MPIKYYYDSAIKKPLNPIEKIQKAKTILSYENRADLTASGLDYTLWHPAKDWIAHDVLLHYSGATNRSYSINKVIGRGIISKLNDLLWIECSGYPTQSIYLDQGFYDGTTLSSQIKTKLDANVNFIASGAAPFTVSYSSITGKFTMAPSLGNIRFFNTNTCVGVNRNSTGGAAIGFNSDSLFAASIESDTAIFGLGNKIPINSETTCTDLNTVINAYSLSPHLDVDTALNVTISAVALNVDYKITFEEYF